MDSEASEYMFGQYSRGIRTLANSVRAVRRRNPLAAEIERQIRRYEASHVGLPAPHRMLRGGKKRRHGNKRKPKSGPSDVFGAEKPITKTVTKRNDTKFIGRLITQIARTAGRSARIAARAAAKSAKTASRIAHRSARAARRVAAKTVKKVSKKAGRVAKILDQAGRTIERIENELPESLFPSNDDEQPLDEVDNTLAKSKSKKKNRDRRAVSNEAAGTEEVGEEAQPAQ